MDELLARLPRCGRDHEVVSYQPPGTPKTPGVRPVWVPAPHAIWWEHVSLVRRVRADPPDVLVAPKTLLPPGLPPRLRTLSLVHDLLYFPIRDRYLHEYLWRDIAYNRLFYRASCRRATALACISQSTRTDLLSVCDVPPEKVHVVLPGVRIPAPDAVDEKAVAGACARYGLRRPYVFYAGSLSPRKNMVRGVHAWARIAKAFPHDLVVTAGKSWRDREVEEAVDRLGCRARFRRLGLVPESEMPALYAGASVSFYPSLYEGFGLPVLEAMACGCPVVASNASAIPEAAGTAALLVDPLDEAAMADALARVLGDAALAQERKAAGLRRAAECSWDRCVRGWLGLLEGLDAA